MKKPQIWIIDDNPIDSYVIKTMLELNELAKEIHIFSNNKEALKKLDLLKSNDNSDSIHIITERKTSTVNGWKLIKKLSKQHENFKFHMASEHYSEKDFKKFEGTEPLYSLNKKPLRLDDLIDIIKS